jgi:hypothetical protein
METSSALVANCGKCDVELLGRLDRSHHDERNHADYHDCAEEGEVPKCKSSGPSREANSVHGLGLPGTAAASTCLRIGRPAHAERIPATVKPGTTTAM